MIFRSFDYFRLFCTSTNTMNNIMTGRKRNVGNYKNKTIMLTADTLTAIESHKTMDSSNTGEMVVVDGVDFDNLASDNYSIDNDDCSTQVSDFTGTGGRRHSSIISGLPHSNSGKRASKTQFAMQTAKLHNDVVLIRVISKFTVLVSVSVVTTFLLLIFFQRLPTVAVCIDGYIYAIRFLCCLKTHDKEYKKYCKCMGWISLLCMCIILFTRINA